MLKKIIAVALLSVLIVTPAFAADIDYITTRPTDGTPIVVFQWSVSADGGEFVEVPTMTTEAEITLPLDDNTQYLIRVRGFDAEGTAGGWSQAATYFHGSPGICSRPEVK